VKASSYAEMVAGRRGFDVAAPRERDEARLKGHAFYFDYIHPDGSTGHRWAGGSRGLLAVRPRLAARGKGDAHRLDGGRPPCQQQALAARVWRSPGPCQQHIEAGRLREAEGEQGWQPPP
jgi:hypothetical protein